MSLLHLDLPAEGRGLGWEGVLQVGRLGVWGPGPTQWGHGAVGLPGWAPPISPEVLHMGRLFLHLILQGSGAGHPTETPVIPLRAPRSEHASCDLGPA